MCRCPCGERAASGEAGQAGGWGAPGGACGRLAAAMRGCTCSLAPTLPTRRRQAAERVRHLGRAHPSGRLFWGGVKASAGWVGGWQDRAPPSAAPINCQLPCFPGLPRPHVSPPFLPLGCRSFTMAAWAAAQVLGCSPLGSPAAACLPACLRSGSSSWPLAGRGSPPPLHGPLPSLSHPSTDAALMHEPYADDASNSGTVTTPLERLRELVAAADGAGLQARPWPWPWPWPAQCGRLRGKGGAGGQASRQLEARARQPQPRPASFLLARRLRCTRSATERWTRWQRSMLSWHSVTTAAAAAQARARAQRSVRRTASSTRSTCLPARRAAWRPRASPSRPTRRTCRRTWVCWRRGWAGSGRAAGGRTRSRRWRQRGWRRRSVVTGRSCGWSRCQVGGRTLVLCVQRHSTCLAARRSRLPLRCLVQRASSLFPHLPTPANRHAARRGAPPCTGLAAQRSVGARGGVNCGASAGRAHFGGRGGGGVGARPGQDSSRPAG